MVSYKSEKLQEYKSRPYRKMYFVENMCQKHEWWKDGTGKISWKTSNHETVERQIITGRAAVRAENTFRSSGLGARRRGRYRVRFTETVCAWRDDVHARLAFKLYGNGGQGPPEPKVLTCYSWRRQRYSTDITIFKYASPETGTRARGRSFPGTKRFHRWEGCGEGADDKNKRNASSSCSDTTG